MYAIIEIGGRQWRVEPGMRLDVNRIPAEVGGTHTVERVLLAHDGQQVQIGRPYLEGARVVCEVVSHRLGPKEISYYFRRRENWRKTIGHRQGLTRLVVTEIVASGRHATTAAARAVEPKTEATKPEELVPTPKAEAMTAAPSRPKSIVEPLAHGGVPPTSRAMHPHPWARRSGAVL